MLLRDAHSQRLRTARHNQTTTEPDLTITRHVIRMTEDSRPCSVRFKSKAGAVNKRIVTKYSGTCSFFSQPIHTACCLPPTLPYLPPPPSFWSFSIRCSLSPGITYISAGGRITDKNPGVLDSATPAGARHTLARLTLPLKDSENHSHKEADVFKRNTKDRGGHTHTDEDSKLCFCLCFCHLSQSK